MKIDVTPKEAGWLWQRRAREDRKLERGPRFTQRPFPGRGQETDPAYLSWLRGLPCIACLIIGSGPREHARIEAAHQKAQDASRGWHKLMGRRVHDRQCAPLCAWHHRIAPGCCDPAQAKFWSMLGVDVIDFCEALHRAFQEGRDGAAVVAAFVAAQGGSDVP